MTRPYALLALVLALTPWLIFLASPRRVERAQFAALRLITKKTRRHSRRRSILLAATRSALIVALVLLWAEPNASPRAPDQTAAETSNEPIRALIVDAASHVDSRPSTARYLSLALDASQNHEARETIQVATCDYSQWLCLAASDLENYDIILLCDPPRLSPIDLEKTAVARKSKIPVLVWAGSCVEPDAWTRTIQERWNPNASVSIHNATSPNAAPRSVIQETQRERQFKGRIVDFRRSQLDQPPITRAVVCQGEGVAPILRDRRDQTVLFAQVAPYLFWCALSPEQDFGALPFLPAFPTFVRAALETTVDAPARRLTRSDNRYLIVVLWSVVFVALCAETALARRAAPARGDARAIRD